MFQLEERINNQRQNFSLQYQYNINQKSDENKEKYHFGAN